MRASVIIASVIERSVRLARATSSTTTVVLLVAVNLVPLVGVLLWGWNVATLLVLYWVENGIVGLLNVPKMLLASAPESGSVGVVRAGGLAVASKMGQVGFFLVHYGLFWFVHGVFVFTLPFFVGGAVGVVGGGMDGAVEVVPGFFGVGPAEAGPQSGSAGPDLSAVALGAIGLALSHSASFVINFLGRREYLRVTISRQMFAPYGRLVILHVTIIIGAMVSLFLGTPIGAIVVLVILKTALDLTLHLREHGSMGTAATG